jgi:ubiquinone/menaquinone biosynthesis C-methylase UbiE
MTESPPQDATSRVARLFDELAPTYDQTGVAFFEPIGRRLVELVDVRPGQRGLDIGCGRGAATFPLAAAVADEGDVTGVDVAPAMVALARARAEREGVANVRFEAMDATDLPLPERAFDVVLSSLVLFFLPDPPAALARWLRLASAGGQVGLSTFGPQDDVWAAVDALFGKYLPAGLLDARTTGTKGPFASDAAMEQLVRDCGARRVRTVSEPLEVVFADAEAWRAFSMSVGQRAMWRQVPTERHEELFAEASSLLAHARRDDGRIVLTQQVRYTLAEV